MAVCTLKLTIMTFNNIYLFHWSTFFRLRHTWRFSILGRAALCSGCGFLLEGSAGRVEVFYNIDGSLWKIVSLMMRDCWCAPCHNQLSFSTNMLWRCISCRLRRQVGWRRSVCAMCSCAWCSTERSVVAVGLWWYVWFLMFVECWSEVLVLWELELKWLIDNY